MKSEAEWIARWKLPVAGGFLYGHVDEGRLTPTQRAEKALRIGQEVEALLKKMYADLMPTPANGQPQRQGAAK